MSDKLPDDAPWTRFDEHNLLLEISEERRLRDLGIDPEMNQLEILEALLKLEADETNLPQSSGQADVDLEDFDLDWH
jgi:hypothetical protein